MKREMRIRIAVHWMMSSVGGFIGAYTIFNRGTLFGAAQTSNMLYMTVKIFTGDTWEVFFRFLIWFVYAGGIAATVICREFFAKRIRMLSIFIDIAAIAAVGLMPVHMNNYIAVCPIAFAMMFQWDAFPGVGEYASATVFSTNNFRQTVSSLTKCWLKKDRAQLQKFRFYTGTLFFFHVGAAASYFLTEGLGLKSLWICAVPLFASLFLETQLQSVKAPGSVCEAD